MMMMMMIIIIIMMMMMIMMRRRRRRMVVMMIMMKMIRTTITFKGANRDFCNLFAATRSVSNTYAKVARNQLCANYVIHIKRVSRATYRVACRVERRDSSAIEFNKLK